MFQNNTNNCYYTYITIKDIKMKKLIITALSIFSMQSFAAVMPNDTVAKQIQDSLNRQAWVLGWNEGAWIDSIKMPYSVTEEIEAELLSKTIAEWNDVLSNGTDEEKQKARSALGVSYLFGVGVEQSEVLGLSYLKLAADKGRASSAHYMAIAYAGGVGNLTEDNIEALKWFKLADKLNKGENKFDLGAVYAMAGEQATTRKDYKQAAEIHKESLALGNKQAAPYLVALYAAGLGVEKDMDKALEYAKQADVKALFNNEDDYNKFGNTLSPETIVALVKMNTANLHSDTYKASSEYHKARLMLDTAAKKKDPIGAYVAHKAARNTKDFNYSAGVISIAAEAGLPAAQYEIADSLTKFNIQPEKSFDLFKKAAENGYGKAYLGYGSELYNKGNHKEALKWLSKASKYEVGEYSKNGKPYIGVATDRYIQSVEMLAKLYFEGEGIERDKGKAFELVEGLIKQVDGKIDMEKIMISPDAQWQPDNFISKDVQIQYYNNRLNGYMSKANELIDFKKAIQGK